MGGSEFQFTEDAAEFLLSVTRWPEAGKPVCPRCGSVGNVYRFRTRRKFKCKDCGREFSVLSGTIFHGHKLSLSQCAEAMLLYEESGFKITPTELAQKMEVSYKTALVLCRKLWEDYIDDARLASRSLLFCGYWQGFNMFRLDDQGRLIAANKRGDIRVAAVLREGTDNARE